MKAIYGKPINSKFIKDWNISSETINILEENIKRKRLNVNIGNVFFFFFFNLTLKAKATKAKINKLGYIKLKISSPNKTISKMKDKLCKGRQYIQTTYPILH